MIASWRTVTPHQIAGEDKSRLVIGPFGSNLRTGDYRSEGVPLVFVRDIRNGTFREARHFVSPDKADELQSHVALPGDVLITKMGNPPGDAAVYSGSGPAIVTADCIRLRPTDDFDSRYVMYAIQSPAVREQVARITSGVAQRKVSLARFRTGISVPAPPIDEQRRIVTLLEDHLSRLDAADLAAASALRRLVALRERSIIDGITGAGLAPRSPAELMAVGTHDGDLPPLPLGWDWARLGEVADVVGGVTKDAKKQGDPSFVEVPYLRVANVQRGHLKLDDVTSIRVAPNKAAALALQPGDVLLNEGGDRDKLARGWVWEGQIEGCIHQNHVFRARIHEPRLDPYFLSWTANTLGGRWAERNGKQSVNLASISLRVIRNMPVIVPPGSASSEIVRGLHDQFASLDRMEAAANGVRSRSAALRRSLLAAAFSGCLTGSTRDLSVAEEMMPA